MLKNITLSAEETLIQQARDQARKQKTTLNQLFRDWLKRYTQTDRAKESYTELMQQLGYANSGQKFTRDEMNER